MQETRLNNIINSAGDRLGLFFSNPWRRIALVLISLLLGIFVADAVSSTAGQAGKIDIVLAAIFLLFTESTSRIVYSRNPSGGRRRTLWVEVVNMFKIGLVYSLYIEAFKLGS